MKNLLLSLVFFVFLYQCTSLSPIFVPQEIIGYWQGSVRASPFISPYQVELRIWSNGQYSCHTTTKGISTPCFYFGSDYESPRKTFNINFGTGFSPFNGTARIIWETEENSTVGSIGDLVVNDNLMTFFFNYRFARIEFGLKRVDKNYIMCLNYCQKRSSNNQVTLYGVCNFEKGECVYNKNEIITMVEETLINPEPQPVYYTMFIVWGAVLFVVVACIVIVIIMISRRRKMINPSVGYVGGTNVQGTNVYVLQTQPPLAPVFVRTQQTFN